MWFPLLFLCAWLIYANYQGKKPNRKRLLLPLDDTQRRHLLRNLNRSGPAVDSLRSTPRYLTH
jgi:hypothetical protein